MNNKPAKPFVWMAVFVLVVGLACGVGGGGTEAEPTEPAATQAPTQPEATTAPQAATTEPQVTVTEAVEGGAITSLEDARNAVIQIESQGTFVNPDATVSYNTAGYGSGFIIDPSGIAVTNNHVVTGSALLKVWIGGDKNKTYNAKILGVSECSDLAVIDLEGDDFPYLDWHAGPVNVGLEVFAAGYPLGEPQYTMTKGIVSKEQADGETGWASVDSVIEHDATINPGNSGGPLLDENGQVVGVNYSGRETNQYYAIGQDLAKDVIDTLSQGQNLESIGVNGEAFTSEDFSGIWVYSVDSGSPADKTGIAGGDIITTMENLVLATDGTMADYCDILRSHDATDPLNIEILRYASQEILTGQLNGRELETAVNFEQTVDEEVQVEDTGAYSGYTTVTDEYGAIQMDVPSEWTELDGGYWEDGGDVIGSQITSSADLNNYFDTWTESGVFFGASDDLAKLGGYVNLLDIRRDSLIDNCKLDARYDYEDAIYRGKYDLYTNCDQSGNAYIVLTAVPNDNSQSYLILVEMQITKEADFDALDRILSTFQVIGSLP